MRNQFTVASADVEHLHQEDVQWSLRTYSYALDTAVDNQQMSMEDADQYFWELADVHFPNGGPAHGLM